jgi:alpha-tubulin suppressor-like RCC1 family protein
MHSFSTVLHRLSGSQSQRVATGSSSSTFEIRNGTLLAWGHNAFGQLGFGNTTQQTSPLQVGTDFEKLLKTAQVADVQNLPEVALDVGFDIVE